MPFIQYPAVPPYQGVPAIPAAPGAQPYPDTVPTLTQDDPSASSLASTPTWGVFNDDGLVIVDADSVISVEYIKEYRICDYPVEPGSSDTNTGNLSDAASFASYNKVELPYDIRITFAKGGNDDERSAFLNNLKNLVGDLVFYTVNTPDATYDNANIVRMDYNRTSQSGVTLLLVNVIIRQIRTTGQTTFTKLNTVDPNSSDPVSNGTVYPQTPTTPQTAIINGGSQ